ncbi:MAG: type I DNA topoisomerase [Bacteroidia bacterium]
MADNLVIVESPAKAKTIEGFLGSDFIVKSSYGHVRDLAKNDKAVNVANNFEPNYEISEDKVKVIADLAKLAKKAKTVWLATDEDREGEAISWHLFEALELKDANTKRIVFHEITKSAIQEAIENPRKIDKHLVDAQQARRILDRLVGFELSPILWKKIKPSLSAGRVQSVAVRLIVEREREVEAHKFSSAFKVTANFLVTDDKGISRNLKAELPSRFKTKEDAESFLQKSLNATYTISNLEKKPGKKSPSAPFTTSTLQQEASRKLGFSVAQTMLVAQKLYEAGKITYMRTDSVNLSQTALNAAKKEIISSYGEKYVNTKQYVTKSASAQEAHEAIRPTYFQNSTVDGDHNERRLYELIWKRTIASQMSDAQLERTIVTVNSDKVEENFVATGEVIIFDGFLTVYLESSDDENTEDAAEGLLPPLTIGQNLDLDFIEARERFSYPPSRYTEASLVKKLEELGIGRPSTYAPTISTVQKRGYVVKEDRMGKERKYFVITLKNDSVKQEQKTETTGTEKAKLFPTDIGAVVNDFLVQNFEDVLDYNFTAYVEKEFDEIAEGKLKWQGMLAEFYQPFHKNVKHTSENAERASGERILGIDPKSGKTVSARIGKFGPMVQMKMNDEDEKPQYASLRPGQRLETITFEEALDLFKGDKILGVDPKSGKIVSARVARYGPVVQMKTNDGDDKPQYANLRPGQSLETITLEDALELFKLPRTLGKFEDKDLIVSIGKFGPYIKQENSFTSLPKTDDPYEVTLERSIEIILDKRSKPDLIKNPRNLGKHNGEDVTVSRGRFGPFIKFKNLYCAIPRDEDPFLIELPRAIEIIEAKKQSDIEKIIKIFDENKDAKILKGRYGPYVAFGKMNLKIPKNQEPESLTYEDVLRMAEAEGSTASKSKGKGKKTKKAAGEKSGAVASKKSTGKKAAKKK